MCGNGLNGISIGMYGHITDADFKEKKRIMEEYAKVMGDACEYNYDTKNGIYLSSITSCKVLRKQKQEF